MTLVWYAQVCVFAAVGLFVALSTQILFSLLLQPLPLTSQPYPQLIPSFQSHLHLGSCNSWSVLINKKIFAKPSIHYLI